VRVVIADDHQLFRDGLRALLAQAGVDVVGEASDGREAVSVIQRTGPDLVLMDIGMPELNGIDATKRTLEVNPATKVIALSMNADRRSVLAMFEAGARGYLLKSSAADELITAINSVDREQKYVSPRIAALVLDALAERSADTVAPRRRTPPSFPAVRPLSTREREVLQLIAEGKSSKEIGATLDLSIATVDTHRRQIMDKLGIRTIAELTKYAIREGLTSVD
jgi:DNA-binding NarL/FixJ family response regulator